MKAYWMDQLKREKLARNTTAVHERKNQDIYSVWKNIMEIIKCLHMHRTVFFPVFTVSFISTCNQ